MTATIPRQDTTVQLPDVSAQALQAIVQTMLAQEPAAAKRIRKGLDLFLLGQMLPTAELGVYLVESDSLPGTWYRATSFTCCCIDAQRNGPGCKHARCLQILSAASAEEAAERQQRDFERRRMARVGAA